MRTDGTNQIVGKTTKIAFTNSDVRAASGVGEGEGGGGNTSREYAERAMHSMKKGLSRD